MYLFFQIAVYIFKLLLSNLQILCRIYRNIVKIIKSYGQKTNWWKEALKCWKTEMLTRKNSAEKKLKDKLLKQKEHEHLYKKTEKLKKYLKKKNVAQKKQINK